jgi:hypothetical protein
MESESTVNQISNKSTAEPLNCAVATLTHRLGLTFETLTSAGLLDNGLLSPNFQSETVNNPFLIKQPNFDWS